MITRQFLAFVCLSTEQTKRQKPPAAIKSRPYIKLKTPNATFPRFLRFPRYFLAPQTPKSPPIHTFSTAGVLPFFSFSLYNTIMAMLCTKIHKSNLNKEDQESYDRINKGNKLFLCFRPVIMDGSDYVNRGRGHSNSFARYVQMEDKDGVIFAHLYSDLPSSAASSFSSQTEKEVDGHRKKKSKRKFLRAIKAVLFETSLVFSLFFFFLLFSILFLNCDIETDSLVLCF